MGGVSDSDNLPLHHAPEIEDGSKIEEIDELEAEDVVLDDDRPLAVNRTYIINCQTVTVYSNSFNAKDVKVRDSGNNTPQVSCKSCSLLFMI